MSLYREYLVEMELLAKMVNPEETVQMDKMDSLDQSDLAWELRSVPCVIKR